MTKLLKQLRCAALLLVGVILLPTLAKAQEIASPTGKEIPPFLQPWVPWVLADLGEKICTPKGDARICDWPGRLSLRLNKTGGSFSKKVKMGAASFHALPGQEGAWPLRVKVDKKARPVLMRKGRAIVYLTRGEHLLEGDFTWPHIPETLHVGKSTAFLSLVVEGRKVPILKREDGNIWLKGLSKEEQGSAQSEHVELSVFRKLQDGVPLIVETRLVFQVSGRAREVQLQSPLVPGTSILSLQGSLAMALQPGQ